MEGNTLLVTLCVTVIIGAALGTYLKLLTNQNQMVAHSQVWNACIPMAEAGVEEALTHCTENYITNMVSNGWVKLGTTNYIKTNWVGNGYYVVRISQKLPYEIISRGYYPMPRSSSYLSRTVRVRTTNGPVFTGAMILRDSVQMNGNNVKTDSYDSRDNTKSTGGRYDVNKAGDSGDVACANGIANSVGVGNANVWGHVYVGAAGSVAIGPSGAIGSVAWQKSGASGIEPGWIATDFNVSFPDVKEPFTSAGTPGSGTVDGTNYNYIMGTGKYMAAGLDGDVLVTGQAVLYVTGNINFGTSGSLYIRPGASLKLYMAGSSALFNAILNQSATANSFHYYGLPSNTSITVKPAADLVAAIYAPNADVILNGTGEIFGSVVARSAMLNGSSAVHYDEALLPLTPIPQNVIVSWDEL